MPTTTLNTINDQFFKDNPDKILGEMTIEKYMNKIVVNGTKEGVEKYFEAKLKTDSIPDTDNEDIYEMLSDIEDPLEAIEMLKMLDSNDITVKEALDYLNDLI